MPLQFQDDFAPYTVGQDPFGDWLDLGFFKGSIVALSNFFGRSGKGYHMGLDGPIGYGISTPANQTASTTIVWEGLGNNNLGPTVTINQGTASAALGQELARFQIENDHTASIIVPSLYGSASNTPLPICNSGIPLFEVNTWQMWQVAINLAALIGTGTDTNVYLTVAADVWFSGTHIMAGFGQTQLNVVGLALGATLNRYSFGGGFSHLGEIYATTDLLGTATYPFPGTPLGGAARDTQHVVEILRKDDPSVRHARMTQGVVEIIERPPTRQARITQGVVEIIRRGGSGGWQVYEA